ncbi:MAG: helix-turn-helix transcriptional regulator [Candidatus Omnitrophica bacterium]|nr:helix-turn-helix transcriptional regulator [Candidatus Omnitrophota bacterium]
MNTNKKEITSMAKEVAVATMVESIVGCKWSMRVLQLIKNKTIRPGEMQRSTPGLSTKVLNERLNKLMRFGIVQKKIYPVTPPHVEYSFTPFGRRFLKIISSIEKLQKEISLEASPHNPDE